QRTCDRADDPLPGAGFATRPARGRLQSSPRRCRFNKTTTWFGAIRAGKKTETTSARKSVRKFSERGVGGTQNRFCKILCATIRMAQALHAFPHFDGAKRRERGVGSLAGATPVVGRGQGMAKFTRSGRARAAGGSGTILCLCAMDCSPTVERSQKLRGKPRRRLDGGHPIRGQLLQRRRFLSSRPVRARLVRRRATGNPLQGR